ncbi:MAG: Eco57I restriction-modification methylase domain-containing protein [Pyrinomonadaceae bacterium]
MEPTLTTRISGATDQCADEAVRTTSAVTQTRHELGQFLTPKHVADFMASLFSLELPDIQLLDAGAGTGALTDAFVRRCCLGEHQPKRLSVTAYEVDVTVLGTLRRTLRRCQQECERNGIEFSSTIHNEDFISAAAAMLRLDLFSPELPVFNAAIVNPPYRKLRSDSSARHRLRSVGIETSNFYTGFVALIIKLLANGGEVVAITPRSFCNGPYFKPFREELLERMSLRRLHLFESRSAAFGKDDVLQENVIVHAVKGEKQVGDVIISSSSGGPTGTVSEYRVPYFEVVSPNDSERFIHFGLGDEHRRAKVAVNSLEATLASLNLTVSTGRVVDFRSKSFLRKEPGPNTAPLIYPCHFNGGAVVWPKKNSKKPNAIMIHEKTRELLVPAGIYVLVKRFSSKEERRRIVACIYDPAQVSAERVAFENHLNYFHIRGHGLPMSLAKGLAAFLNSTMIDSYFRQFSGHTQVNATDLRRLNYPTATALENLGRKIQHPISQGALDELLEAELF